jgi:hypothetical protein
MSAKLMPPISRVGSEARAGSGGATDPGGPPTFAVGVGVGRPGSGGEGWSGMGDGRGVGDDEGASLRVAATGPHATTQSRRVARSRLLMPGSLATTWSRGPDFADAGLKRYETNSHTFGCGACAARGHERGLKDSAPSFYSGTSYQGRTE